jgi:hypothetical protein
VEKQCAQFTFRADPDGRIAGRIVDEHGHPLGDVEVFVLKLNEIPPKQLSLDDKFREVNNNDDGTFTLAGLPPGQYILAAYVWALPQGFPANPSDRNRLTAATLHFYPGRLKNEAVALNLEFGQHFDGLTITIPFDPSAWKDVESH